MPQLPISAPRACAVLLATLLGACSAVIDTDPSKLGSQNVTGLSGDTCDESCDDGIDCTVDVCDAMLGCVHRADATRCDDKVNCTEDICDVKLGCRSQESDARCEFCAPGSRCDAKVGGCVGATDRRDCDDGNPCTEDSCSVAAMMCVAAPIDRDGDGFAAMELGARTCAGDDCDDAMPQTHPGAKEVCDGVDNDCNGRADDGCTDMPDNCASASKVVPDADGVALIEGQFAPLSNDFDVSCGAPAAPDAIYRIPVNQVADIVFDATDSDTKLVLAAGSGCDDTNFATGCAAPMKSGNSRLVFHRYDPALRGADLFLLVEPGAKSERGAYHVQVRVTPAHADTCASEVFDHSGCGTLVGFMHASAVGTSAGSCQTIFGGAAPESMLRIQGAEDGNVSIEVTSDAFAPSLYARTACQAGFGTTELGCDASQGGSSGNAQLDVPLRASEEAFVFVDSGDSGARYTLRCEL
jgi:hypothetical protein